MPVTIMAKNYSHCPLKKRPVQYTEDDLSPVSDEPENLSTKPEDLSLTSRNKSPPLSIVSSSPPGSPVCSSPSPPPSSVTSSTSPPPIPLPVNIMRSPSPTITPHSYHHHHLYAPTAIKMEPYIKPELEYAPQTWARSIYPPAAGGYHHIPLHYPHPYEYLGVNSPPASTSSYNSDSSCSPPHNQYHMHHHIRQPLQPLALRPSSIYSSMDSNSLSPNSSTTTSPPPAPVIITTNSSAEDLTHVVAHHMDKKNGNGVRHKCPDCGKSYSTFSGLSKHRQFHCAAGDGPRKSFSCKYCEKIYVSLGALKMHIRTHTLPCKCTICGKAFSRPWLLQGHIRTHTGEKPFSCTYCHRAFADRSNLRAHLQTHSDVKKYSCPTCGKMFSRMSLLTKHAESGCGSIPGAPMVH